MTGDTRYPRYLSFVRIGGHTRVAVLASPGFDFAFAGFDWYA